MIPPRLRPFLWLVALMAVAVALRAPFFSRELWSLDEGSTFTMAQQVRQGDVLYRDAVDNRSPLLPYLKAAIFAVAGDWNARAAHIALALALGACAFVLWRIGRRLGDNLTGVAAACVFTALSFLMLDEGDALAVNTGWCVALFSTFGFGAFAWAVARPTFLRALPVGILFSCSFLSKQPGLLDFGVTWVLLGLLALQHPGQRRTYLRFWFGLLVGAALPVFAFLAYFAARHALADFLYYAFTYNTVLYIPAVPRLQRLAGMADPFILIWLGSPVLAVLGAAAAIGLLITALRSLATRPFNLQLLPWLILGWSAAGVLSTGLSGRNFSHYSAQAVPGFSLACGWALAQLVRLRQRSPARARLRPVIAGALGLIVIAVGFDYARRARRLDPHDVLVPQLGQLIQTHSPRNERIFVWGYFPEIYYFSHRLPATRFVYTNFVTGMIPWINLDPLVDTTPTSVPGSAAQLEFDWERHPPSVVVDTRGSRGYVKYPLHAQPVLWSRVRSGYAEVSVAHADRLGVRLFRRLRADPPEKRPEGLAEDPGIVLAGYRSYQRAEPARLRVEAPAGARRLELFAGEERVAVLDHPAAEPVDVIFFADPASPPGTLFRVAITATDSSTRISAPFDFGAYAETIRHEQLAGPELHLERIDLLPLTIDTLGGKPEPSPTMPGFWKITAPMELDYAFPSGLRSLDFVHGLEMEAWGHSDGYDLVIEHQSDQGAHTELLRQRLHPQTSRPDREVHKMHLDFPPLGAGRLVFRFLAGEKNNADNDWIYLGEMHGHSPGPILRVGQTAILPTVATTRGDAPMLENNPGIWAAHTPAKIEWPRPPELRGLTFKYGIEDAAFAKTQSHSDGVEVSVDLVDDRGESRRLFSRLLEPFNHPDQRGSQVAIVSIPPDAPGNRVVLRVGPGPNGDASWDWAWLSDISTRAIGPSIELPDGRELAPVSIRELGNAPARYLNADHWGAHADAEVVYRRPENLAKVTFSYGLAEGADRDDAGQQRSDGVEILALFEPATGRPVELFRRLLDPFHRPADLGQQTSTITLPSREPGRLIFRVTPGPAHNNAFDWAFWGGHFTGELSQ